MLANALRTQLNARAAGCPLITVSPAPQLAEEPTAMNWLEALILGLLQALTEFLPVSSSGHLEIGKVLLGLEETLQNPSFTITLHAATALSTIIVFRKDIGNLLVKGLTFQNRFYSWMLGYMILSAVPVGLVGLFFKEAVERLFAGNLVLVGAMLMLTGGLLLLTRQLEDRNRPLTWGRALLIGVAQAFAVLPGISRSGATIATGLLLGLDRHEAARFSFLMAIAPILGVALLDTLEQVEQGSLFEVGLLPIGVGFVSALVAGTLVCRWMVSIVRRGNLHYFAFYCGAIGLIALIIGFV